MNQKITFILAAALLSSCARVPMQTQTINHFVQPHRRAQKQHFKKTPHPKVLATFGYGNDPKVIKAYNHYLKTGKKPTVKSNGFKTLAFDAHSKPLLACAPLHLCVVQLEQGETINNIELGDSENWLVDTARLGTTDAFSYQIALKPKVAGIATDMVVATTKRSYHIGLVSQAGNSSEVVNFYYPEETFKQNLSTLKAMQKEAEKKDQQTIPYIDLAHVNFHYGIKGHHFPWTPTRVFDDGTKTYIELPPISERFNLPVLYQMSRGQVTLVNTRYRRPYLIVDGLFKKVILQVGKGRLRQRIAIYNRNHYSRRL